MTGKKKGLATISIVASPLILAERTGLEPATPGVTGRYQNPHEYWLCGYLDISKFERNRHSLRVRKFDYFKLQDGFSAGWYCANSPILELLIGHDPRSLWKQCNSECLIRNDILRGYTAGSPNYPARFIPDNRQHALAHIAASIRTSPNGRGDKHAFGSCISPADFSYLTEPPSLVRRTSGPFPNSLL